MSLCLKFTSNTTSENTAVHVAKAKNCSIVMTGMWCSLRCTIVTMINLMKSKITSLVWQCKSNVVIYQTYLPDNCPMYNGYQAYCEYVRFILVSLFDFPTTVLKCT